MISSSLAFMLQYRLFAMESLRGKNSFGIPQRDLVAEDLAFNSFLMHI